MPGGTGTAPENDPSEPTGIVPSPMVAGSRKSFTSVPGLKPDPDASAVGSPTTHITLGPDPFKPTDRVVVIEDVITTGGSALKAIDAVRAAGATVLGVLAVVDREEGGREAIAASGVIAIALAGAAAIVARMPESSAS